MVRYFNIAGPCNRKDHYMIEASSRLQGVEQLIEMKQYFIIHAARQLREGYNDRSTVPFIHSLALAGMRNIRDYKARVPITKRLTYFLVLNH